MGKSGFQECSVASLRNWITNLNKGIYIHTIALLEIKQIKFRIKKRKNGEYKLQLNIERNEMYILR